MREHNLFPFIACKTHVRGHTRGIGIAVEMTCSISLHLGSNLFVHACHPRGALYAHWICRMFSEPWD
jgi:hypothetical protein